MLSSTPPAFAGAVQAARAKVKQSPRSPNAQYDLGLALMQSVKHQLRGGRMGTRDKSVAKEAEQAFKTALRLNKRHGRAHVMLGMLYKFTKRYGEATVHLKAGMRLPPKSQDWWIAATTLVNVYFKQNKPKPAIPVLRALIKQRPGDVDAHYKLGLSYAFTKKKPAAIIEFKKTLKLKAGHHRAATWLKKLQK
ncbi:MAG: tetratricopeptide repeat protein [Deltaproteobacteria bacterium]|nr:tetratricopeptide repeat protein [Deltaproteobacteria bacterium]